jgi:hypothetical protein
LEIDHGRNELAIRGSDSAFDANFAGRIALLPFTGRTAPTVATIVVAASTSWPALIRAQSLSILAMIESVVAVQTKGVQSML